MNVILDCVGGSYWAQNLESLAIRGRLVLVGLLGGSAASVDLGLLMRKRLRVIGTVLRSRTVAEKVALTQRVRADLLPPLERSEIVPVVDRTFSLDKAAEAHRYMEENRNVGKIILEVS